MFDAVLRGHPAHGFGGFPGFGAVVYLGQDMAVNVNHERITADSKRKSKPGRKGITDASS
jgi:hypothetical protein